EERLLNPKFTQDAFNRAKKQSIEGLKNAMVRPNYVASTVFDKVLYGKDNVMGWPTSGTVQTLQNIQLADVENYYKNNFSRHEAKVVVVGDVAKDDAVKHLAFLQKLPDNEIKLPTVPAVPTVSRGKLYFVNIPGAAQTEFRIGTVTGMKYNPLGDYY